jgi:hypothetical protein
MRHGRHQFAGVVSLRIGEEFKALALFNDAARAQYNRALAHHAHDVEVVAYEQKCEIILGSMPPIETAIAPERFSPDMSRPCGRGP